MLTPLLCLKSLPIHLKVKYALCAALKTSHSGKAKVPSENNLKNKHVTQNQDDFHLNLLLTRVNV